MSIMLLESSEIKEKLHNIIKLTYNKQEGYIVKQVKCQLGSYRFLWFFMWCLWRDVLLYCIVLYIPMLEGKWGEANIKIDFDTKFPGMVRKEKSILEGFLPVTTIRKLIEMSKM